MVKQVVNIGTVELRGRDGDTNRVANEKFQANHNETYKALGADGEGNLPTALPIENGGTGATTATNARENLDVDSKAETTQKIKGNVVNNLTTGGIENALSAEMGKNLQSNKLDKTANAVSASKLLTARSFTWTGDVTGSVSFDGAANVTNALTLSSTGVAAGAYGSNIKTVTLTLDAKGRVTAATQQDIRAATTALSGVVQLNDTLTSTLITQAATANAVKKVNDAVLATDIIAKAAIPSSQKGMANGVATLNSSGVIPANQLPSYVDDVLEFATQAAFPATGETGKIYISIETGMTYRWTGTVYAPIGGGSGTSDTALRLFNPRTIAIDGDATGTATPFDGSVNISILLTGVAATKFKTPRKINGTDFDGTKDITIADSLALTKASNLSDLENKTTARTNLDVYSKTESNFLALPLGTPIWHNGTRLTIDDGYASYDGQLLNRADFPTLWAKVQSKFVVITDTDWLSDPKKRAAYSSGDGETTFRMPDLNGFLSDSIKGLFLRGDGNGSIAGETIYQATILKDAIRNITGSGGLGESINTGFVTNTTRWTGAMYADTVRGSTWLGINSSDSDNVVSAFDASRVVPTAGENRPVSAIGIWICRVSAGTAEQVSPNTAPSLTGGNTWAGSQNVQGNLEVFGETFHKGIQYLTKSRWKSYIGSRVFGTTYLNNTPYEKEVNVKSALGTSFLPSLKVTFTDLVTNESIVVYFGCSSNWSGGIYCAECFTVPPYTSYKAEVVRADTPTSIVTLNVLEWWERDYVA